MRSAHRAPEIYAHRVEYYWRLFKRNSFPDDVLGMACQVANVIGIYWYISTSDRHAMGKPSLSVGSSPSVRPRVTSTVLSAVTAFLPFVGLPVASLSSVLDGLVEGVQRVVGITRESKRQELVDFGDYVNNVVNQLVSAFRNDQLAQQHNVRMNLEQLQKVLDAISRQISRNNSEGWFSRIRRLLFPDGNYIPRMRQQLDDALRVFEFAALIELLSRAPNLSAGVAATHASEPSQPRTPNPSDSSNPPAHSLPHTQGSRVAQAAEQAHDTLQLSPQFEHESQPHTRRARLHRTPVVAARSSDLEAGEIIVAFLNVESCRHSLQHLRSPVKKMRLATALGRLSVLLAKAGRAPEALEASQESAALYRTIADREH
ncbi:unnamed protein product [Rhizoctonia solani]|uniref:Uncharacterized protein n=1 Tax=Rhizoctonia solani TaxID=456999 RepID=A0A8H3D3E4_9AGAM|nr:unnamed protein product [Rhizoctonia solani]